MFPVKTFSSSALGSRTVAAPDRYGVVAYAVAHPLFQWENRFVCTGRYPRGPVLISFSA